jgi:lipopolysaccharide/colanic/teichoic acid biosynthesis glycosyltransferase
VSRPFDLVIAALALVVLSPVLLAAALAIKLGSRGPVIYRQRRVGKDGREFELLKLRTMVQGSDPVRRRPGRRPRRPAGHRRRPLPAPHLARPRIPNLVNVLRGEMAIVGPRPTIPAQGGRLHAAPAPPHEVRPGLTGWAQVQGRAGIPWEERIELDVEYVDRRGLALDARILAKTAWLLVTGHGLAPD